MARAPRASTDERLAALTAMARGERAVDLGAVRAGLGDRSGTVVGAAAKVIGEGGAPELIELLGPAFTRLCERPIERDPGCRGKLAIARALRQLERWDDAVFPIGIAWVQAEPVWGGREDTAAPLRALCALAYAQSYRPDVLDVLAELLADPERSARAAAATALGDAGHPDASALLRYKIRVGDPEPEVLTACLASLLALTPDRGLPVVAAVLDEPDPDRAAAAALALGESRRADAAPLLISYCERSPGGERARAGYPALAMLRDPAAVAYLLERVATAAKADAIAAAAALAPYAAEPRLAERLRAAAAAHPDPAVAAATQ